MKRPTVIAHRGASGYLPEHTLEAKALAYGQGADYLEQDVVATRDDQLIVLHDLHLDTVTDVASRFPQRRRSDGRWYARDFTLEEIRTLRVFERCHPGGGAVFPNRFPHGLGRFAIPSLEDEITMLLGLNRSSGRQVGLYPEIKEPAWHREEGVDVAALLLGILEHHGLKKPDDPVFLQCFDAGETRRLREQLGTGLRIIQLIADEGPGSAPQPALTGESLREVATYADGIGPPLSQLTRPGNEGRKSGTRGIVELARARGLLVHPYTFRADALAPGFDSFDEQVRFFAEDLGVDGLFTDFPDLTISALDGGR